MSVIGGVGKAVESVVAKLLGGRLTAASGAAKDKGDITFPDHGLRGEIKSSVSSSLSLKKEWLDKIEHEARMRGESPLLVVVFATDRATIQPNGCWVMLPATTFMESLGDGE